MNDENCKHPVKKYKNMEDRTVGGYTCSLCGKVVVFTEKEKEEREKSVREFHPDEDEPAFPIAGHIEKSYEYDTEVERLRGEKPGLTLIEYYALMCPLPWGGFDRRDNEVQRGNSLRIHAERRLEWARAMLHALRPVKDDGEKM
jgi:hypothetical protein